MSPEHQAFVQRVAPERNEQAPLGPTPSYDEVLDVAVEYTFPASDPLAVQTCCEDVRRRDPAVQGAVAGPHGEAGPSGESGDRG
jgi:predicted component of type VI protein secretion system